jgi:YVTN family beta-propeller protein
MRVSAIVVCALALSTGFGGSATAQGEPTVVDTIFVGHEPTDIVINPLTGRLYVSNEPNSSIEVIDTRLGNVMDPMRPDLRPTDLAVNALTNRIYASARTDLYNCEPAIVIVIDGETHAVLELIRVGCGRGEVIVDPFKNLVYSINHLENGMRVIDGKTNREVQRIPGPLCQCIGINPLTSGLFVVDQQGWVFALGDPTCRERIVGTTRMAVGPLEDRVFLSQGPRDQIIVLDGALEEDPFPVTVGNEPQGVAVNTMTGRTYVTNARSDTVSVIEGDTVIATVAVGRSPQRVTVDPLTSRVYVANAADGTMTVIEDVNPAFPPDRVLIELVNALMVDAGAAAGRLQEALGLLEAGDHDKAAQELFAFSNEIEDQPRPPEDAEKLAGAARRIIMMMIGN